MPVIVGGVVEKNGKYLLVQEAQPRCYGKWNLPAGHLDPNETLKQAAIREIKEETGCDVEITGVLNVANEVMENDIKVAIIFSTKLINENILYDTNEILDVKWFDYDEIINKMDDKLRNLLFVKTPIINHHNNVSGELDLINLL